MNYKLHNPHWKYSAHTSGYHPKQICLLITNFEEILRDDDSCLIWSCCSWRFRAVGWSENLGVPVLFGGLNLLPLVEIGLTDLPKFGTYPPNTPSTGDNKPVLNRGSNIKFTFLRCLAWIMQKKMEVVSTKMKPSLIMWYSGLVAI